MQSKCPVFGIKKSRFIKNQEAKGLLSNLGIKTPLSKIQRCKIIKYFVLNSFTFSVRV